MFVRYDETPEIQSSALEFVDIRLVGDVSKSMLTPDMPMLDGTSQFGLSRADFANNTIALIFDAVAAANKSLSPAAQARVYGYRFSTAFKSMGQLNPMTKNSVYGEAPTGVTNLLEALNGVLADANAAINQDPTRKQVIVFLTDGVPTNAQGKTDTEVPEEQILVKIFKTIYSQANAQPSDESLTIAFIQCSSAPQSFKNYCVAQSMWDEASDTGIIYRDIQAATSFLNIADNRLKELFPDIKYDIVDSLSSDDLYSGGMLKPLADVIAKMIND